MEISIDWIIIRVQNIHNQDNDIYKWNFNVSIFFPFFIKETKAQIELRNISVVARARNTWLQRI